MGLSLCMFCAQSAVVLFTFGTFVPAIKAATGWSPVAIGAAVGPGILLSALLAPVVGLAADRIGVRRVALVGGPAYALGMVVLGLTPQNAGSFVLAMVICCGLGFAGTPLLYAQLATGWFARRRGLALSVMFAVSSLGVAFWSPLAAALIEAQGWRMAYVVLGGAAGAVILLSALLLLRDPPAVWAKAAGGAWGMSLPEALRTSAFWRIAAAFMLLTGALAGAAVNLPVLLRAEGVSPYVAAAVVSVVGVAMFVGRLSAGVLLDRWFAPSVTAGLSLLPVAAFVLLLVSPTVPVFYVAAALIGLGLGSELDAAAYIVSRAFGVRAFGAIYGAVTLAYGLATAAGPGLAGAAIARSIPFASICAAAIAALVPAILLLVTLRRKDLPFGVD